MNEQQRIRRFIIRRTVISFGVFFLFVIGGIYFWNFIYGLNPYMNGGAGVRKPVRNALDRNESIFRKIFSHNHLSKTFPKSKAVKKVRVNGWLGLRNDEDTLNWKLQLVRAPGDTLVLHIEDIKALPKTELVFDFKCIEGWDQITWWGGVQFSELMKKYGLDAQSGMEYVGLITPDHGYYVGIDMLSMLHPQTLLVYEMNGEPLPISQGYPLRLIIPVKYGIKHLKRIGTIYFSNTRPPDYWAERGYDYYSGL